MSRCLQLSAIHVLHCLGVLLIFQKQHAKTTAPSPHWTRAHLCTSNAFVRTLSDSMVAQRDHGVRKEEMAFARAPDSASCDTGSMCVNPLVASKALCSPGSRAASQNCLRPAREREKEQDRVGVGGGICTCVTSPHTDTLPPWSFSLTPGAKATCLRGLLRRAVRSAQRCAGTSEQMANHSMLRHMPNCESPLVVTKYMLIATTQHARSRAHMRAHISTHQRAFSPSSKRAW